MSALLKAPKDHKTRQPTRGGGNRANTRRRPAQQGPVGPKQNTSTGLINVGVVINYGSGGTRQGRFRWPANLSEEQGINEVLKTQTDAEHMEVSEIHFSQAPRGSVRIDWMDDEPKGHYYFNQHLFGEDGLKSGEMPEVDYNPDIPDVQYQGNVSGYSVDAQPMHQQSYDPRMMGAPPMQQQGQDDRVGPGRYDPNDVWGGRGMPPPPGLRGTAPPQYGQQYTQRF